MRAADLERWTGRRPVASAYLLGYNGGMLEVRETSAYAAWFSGLRDRAAKVCIDIRIRRLSLGSTGDVRPVSEGVSELRIHFGPGYRVYFTRQGDTVVVLLAGGDKSLRSKTLIKLSI